MMFLKPKKAENSKRQIQHLFPGRYLTVCSSFESVQIKFWSKWHILGYLFLWYITIEIYQPTLKRIFTKFEIFVTSCNRKFSKWQIKLMMNIWSKWRQFYFNIYGTTDFLINYWHWVQHIRFHLILWYSHRFSQMSLLRKDGKYAVVVCVIYTCEDCSEM